MKSTIRTPFSGRSLEAPTRSPTRRGSRGRGFARWLGKDLSGVLAEEWRAMARRHRTLRAVQPEVVAGVLQRPGLGVVDSLEELPVAEVLVLEHVGDGVDGPGHDAVVLARLADLGARMRQQPRKRQHVELVDAVDVRARLDGRPLRRLDQRLVAHHAQRGVNALRAVGHQEEAVGAGVHPAADARGERRPRRVRAAVLVHHQPRQADVDRMQRRLVEVDVDVLALAAQLRAADRDRGGKRADEPGVVARHAACSLDRLIAGLAGDEHRAAHRVEREVGADPVAVRPVLPEVRDRGQHEARVHLA